MNKKHTELPWIITKIHGPTSLMGEDGHRHICSTGGYQDNRLPDNGAQENKSNAEFIVKAVNNHDALVDALEQIVDCYDRDLFRLVDIVPMAREVLERVK